MDEVRIQIKRVRLKGDVVPLPAYMTEGSAGMDLSADLEADVVLADIAVDQLARRFELGPQVLLAAAEPDPAAAEDRLPGSLKRNRSRAASTDGSGEKYRLSPDLHSPTIFTVAAAGRKPRRTQSVPQGVLVTDRRAALAGATVG